MPMVWNSQADARLLQAVIKVFVVKGAKMQDVAKLMGPECTPKALTHRLTKIRELAKSELPDVSDTKEEDVAKPAKRPRKAPCTARKRGKEAIRTPSPGLEREDEELINGALTPPATSERAKRNVVKRTYTAESSDGDDEEEMAANGEGSKSVKTEDFGEIEVGEDIGEGLRSAQ